MAKVFSIGGHTISYGGFMLREQGVGSLTITKTVSGVGFDPAKTFEIVVTFGKAIKYKVNGTAILTPSNVYVANLASGQSVTLSDIPEGTTYNVAETPLSQADIEAGYSATGITGNTGKVAYNGEYNTLVSNSFYAVSTLTVNCALSGTAPTNPIPLPFKVVCNGVTYKFSLTPGSSYVLQGLPVGYAYTVSAPTDELDYRTLGYSVYSSSGTYGTIASGGNTCTITFAYSEPSFNTLSTPKTVRVRFYSENAVPTGDWALSATWTRVSTSPNVWDMTYNANNWSNISPKLRFDQLAPFDVIAYGDMSGVTSIMNLFKNAPIVSSVPVEFPDVISVIGLFEGCSSLTDAPYMILPSCTVFTNMFRDCTSLVKAPMIIYDSENTTSSPRRMTSMFSGCSSLTYVPKYETKNIHEFNSMFSGCSALEEVPLFNTQSAVDMSSMLSHCVRLKEVPLFNTSTVTNVTDMLNGCLGVESGALALYTQMSTQSTPPQNHSSCFAYCGRDTPNGYLELSQIPQSWGGLAT